MLNRDSYDQPHYVKYVSLNDHSRLAQWGVYRIATRLTEETCCFTIEQQVSHGIRCASRTVAHLALLTETSHLKSRIGHRDIR